MKKLDENDYSFACDTHRARPIKLKHATINSAEILTYVVIKYHKE